jgi:hypothetical protein
MSYSTSRTPGTLSVFVPRQFSLFLCVFYPLWLGGWVTLAALNPSGKPLSAFLLVCFALLSVVFAYSWLWNLGGREELEFTGFTLTSRRILFGISRTKVFQMDKITDPHFVISRRRGPMSGTTPSGLAFCHDGRSFRLCDHLAQAEATAIVSEIIQQFPQHAERWSGYDKGIPDCESDVPLRIK